MIVSIFDHYQEKNHPKYVEVDKVFESIRKCNAQKKIDAFKAETDKAKRKHLKGQLPCILFAGKFSKRFDNCLLEHSGLCVLDKDHIGTIEQVLAEKSEVIKLPYVYACFISPSGDGLKVIIRIPADKERHRGHYTALMKLFPQLDSTSINESRICYASADPDIYVNKNAVEFTEWIEPEKKKTSDVPVKTALYTNYSAIDIAVKMIREAKNGKKHEVLLDAANL